jgi:hypothetical protein
VARGNLSRATGDRAASSRCLLVHSLNGQHHYAEALTESERPSPPTSRARNGRSAMAAATALHGLGRRHVAVLTARQAACECERFLHPAHPRIREAREPLARLAADGSPPEDPAPNPDPEDPARARAAYSRRQALPFGP